MNRYKIMLVDDEPDILDLLEKALNIEGFYNITKIDNGISAVITCKEIHLDIIILDVMLPDIDGYEVCKKIREFSHCPILFLSSKNDELMIDTDGCRVMKNNKEIGLTAREFEILRYLAENLGRVISRECLQVYR
ncbi:hypothetical protein C806_02662 [Lachnospiraceae bacterium 3-1]|nr:hypothetical protein C806_02662 [Lachnospiraceae bacterium 3-1]